MGVLVDSNVLLDILTDDAAWKPWSRHELGAHAAVQGWAVLTRDVARYRTAFPDLRLIAP